MQYSGFDHISLNVSNLEKSRLFYNALLTFLGFKKVGDEEDATGWSNGPNGLWINETNEKYTKDFHRKNIGINHLAFRATSREAVDHFYNEFLLKNNIIILYEKPQEYPEYREDYYAVFFEDPDRLKLEVMYFSK
jgi:catechol 2,3-dioxygenase-like lactoylglutathione lyase family enzyme